VLDRPISAWVGQAGLPLPTVVVANLPYNAATAILSRAIEDFVSVSRIVATVQREVARRWVATPGSDDYGYLSVRAALFSRAEILFDIPAGSFQPRPKVVSSVLRLVPKAPPVAGPVLARVLAIASASFQMRRKNLPNALAGIGLRRSWAEALDRCGLSPNSRAEELSAADFVRLEEAERKIPEPGE
jgi:16S rRNA (adenine1518-N6/adenine1519-N6)-dimethyltransferase